MKTITLLSFAFVFFTFPVHAQISKGSVLLGGSVNFSNANVGSNSNDYKNNYFTIRPSLGFAVKENKVVGFHLIYGHGENENGPTQTSEMNQYGGGIFLRKYLTLGKGFYLFGQGQTDIFYQKEEVNSAPNSSVQKLTSVGVSLFPGLSYAVSRRFHLELTMNNLMNLSYTATNQVYKSPGMETTNKSKQLSFAANVNPASNLSLGFRILLGNKVGKG